VEEPELESELEIPIRSYRVALVQPDSISEIKDSVVSFDKTYKPTYKVAKVSLEVSEIQDVVASVDEAPGPYYRATVPKEVKAVTEVKKPSKTL
jgi:hypothetical protein